MTPAVNIAKRAKITYRLHEYDHDPDAESFGEEAVSALGVEPSAVFKTLIVSLGRDAHSLGVGVVPVACQLDLKSFAEVMGVKKAMLADIKDAERNTGYVAGGISPLGQRRRLPTVLDSSAMGFNTVFVSAGRRGLEIELAPEDLLRLCQALSAPIAR
jgi:Cys-tRNA(Pro)/Cys-tRNA(Cys) deacylase